MSVLIPDYGHALASPAMLDWGGNLSPVLGGPEQRLNRLGNRFAVTITTGALDSAEEGRILLQRLLRAKTDGAVACFPQGHLKVGAPGSPVVNGAVSGGISLPIRGLSSDYVVREGQFFSIIHAGRRYLYSSNSQVSASAGTATLEITPMLRTPLSDGDIIEMAPPMIEGLLDGDQVGWERAAQAKNPFTFTIREMA